MSYTSETGSLGLARQDVKGTFHAPTDYMKIQSIDMNPDGEKLIPDPEIGGISDIDSIHQGTYKIGGSVDTYIRPEAIGILFHGALGSYTPSGLINNGAYLHNFTPLASGSLPWISVKKSISDDVQVFNYTDCKVEGFSIDINASEYCTAKFDIVGISDAVGVAGSESYESAPLLVATKATINIGGVSVSAKKATIEFKNNLNNDDFRVGSRFLGDITEKRRELDLKMDIVLDTTSELYRKSFYGAAAATTAGFAVYADSVDILLDSPTNIATSAISYKILFQIKNAVFMAAPTPASGDDLVVIPLELKATKSGTNNLFEVHIWNSKSLY
jgi:hypothetical protein